MMNKLINLLNKISNIETINKNLDKFCVLLIADVKLHNTEKQTDNIFKLSHYIKYLLSKLRENKYKYINVYEHVINNKIQCLELIKFDDIWNEETKNNIIEPLHK